ncbi:MAG: 4-hydroxy-3-methylbut-2-enyl diphosphate reductase [Crocinitomicaceae bacterium]|nr:4-hydroxy-3-methylbut-2-enyl diphosphate reductase [Crocinitomicaceae bacterium]
MKHFEIPFQYQSLHINRIKRIRENADKRKQDLSPSLLTFEHADLILARHFGFCFGVQNAVERAYHILEDNPGKNIYLLSEIIHNPEVNKDLQSKGLKFIQNTKGEQLIAWDSITPNDIVIIPAFGTTNDIEAILRQKQLSVENFDTTCPFVERVWNKGEKLGKEGYSIVLHGNPEHEETRATMSKISEFAPVVIVTNHTDADMLREYINGNGPDERDWNVFFKSRASKGFNFRKHLNRIAVVNQTTMLAEETEKISNFLKDVMLAKYGSENIEYHFGSTRDTLCYATNDNQQASAELAKQQLDLVIVVGGHNSSNTTHLVELLKKETPTYFISSEMDLLNEKSIRHFDIEEGKVIETYGYLPKREKLRIGLTSGASCPDALMERVMLKLLSFTDEFADIDAAIDRLEEQTNGL